MEGVNKKQKKFFLHLMILFLSLQGRYNFLQFERYGGMNEQSYRNQFGKSFDFLKFNMSLLATKVGVIAFDPSFIKKSGKATPYRRYFWNGCVSKAEKGLELCGISFIELEAKVSYHLEAIQTKVNKSDNETLLDYYCKLIKSRALILKGLSDVWVADGYFAKKKVVVTIKEVGCVFVSKLRKDANLKFLFTGAQRCGRGRHRKYESKINMTDIDFEKFERNEQDEVVLYSKVVWSVGLKTKIKLVIVKCENKMVFLFSTDLSMTAQEIFKIYSSRFQIEFLFRDAKQFCGLTDCQARNEQSIYYHWNASLTAVSIAKIMYKQDGKPFSMTNVKRQFHNKLLLDLFLSNFEIEPNLMKNKQIIDIITDFGKIAA